MAADNDSSQRGLTHAHEEKRTAGSNALHASSSLQNSTATDNDSLVTADSEDSFHLSQQETDHFEVSESWGPKSSAGSRVSNVLCHFGLSSSTKRGGPTTSSAPKPEEDDAEIIDFTYVNVQETDADEVDILLAGGDPGLVQQHSLSAGSLHEHAPAPPNILALFLSGRAEDNAVTLKLVDLSEQANEAVQRAATAKQEFKLSEALDAHSTAARLFHEAALLLKDRNSASMANSFLLLSQTEAKSALTLKRVIKLRPSTLLTKERLRATVRGALDKKAEADISDSMFLGTADPIPPNNPTMEAAAAPVSKESEDSGNANPVDDIMQLERELQNMDMGLELGNSIASLDSRNGTRLRNSTVDGSFMVVPPGSNSYLSSSMVLPANPPRATSGGNRTTGRSRANRVQNMIEATSTTARPFKAVAAKPVPAPAPPAAAPAGGLESSWWGSASQVLSSSVSEGQAAGGGAAPTKQLMRLMDSLKTLGDENAALLREVEDAEAARAEAKAAKKEMQRFRVVYSERFEKLKSALEKFRKGHPDQSSGTSSANPVGTSEYMQQASTSEQLARQEQLIRKLTADLKKEKEENRKKDAAIRKYESFYREVKARSAQKAAQRRTGTRQQQQEQVASSAAVK